MNLINFLKQTDALTAQYSVEQLSSFIHDIGRTLPEERREDFLKRLKMAGNGKEKTADRTGEQKNNYSERYHKVMENLKTIDSQEISVTAVWNEEYNDWYDDISEEFFYEDHENISGMLKEACDFVHTCMDEEMYKEGFRIGTQLFTLEILCESDYDPGNLSIEDMVYHGLLDYDMKQLALDTLYCAYHATTLKKRPEVLYGIMFNVDDDKVTLETMMQHGDGELPDFKEFLKLWIDYLGTKTGEISDRLYSEALVLTNDISEECHYAGKFVSYHPGAYLDILKNTKSVDAKAMVSIGLEAVKKVPKKYTMRSRIALETADYIVKLKGERNLLEMCYFAAYESDTSALNYLRALFNGYGTENKKEELRNVFMELSMKGKRDSFGRDYLSEREENDPDKNMIWMLKFFDGQFARVLERGLNTTTALGWTDTFMKQGIALFLLLLYEGKWNGRGIYAMADIVKKEMGFSAEKYQKGLAEIFSGDEKELFYRLFSDWKSTAVVESGLRKKIMDKLDRLIEKRTEGIMSANRRNYYGECAAYIAALGEVKESCGEIDAKQRLMTSYKEKYSRRTSFRAEMKGYGWIDIKKKK